MVFGDLNDPESNVSQLAKSGRATQFLGELGTKPKVFYLESAKGAAAPVLRGSAERAK
jgi:Fe-S-cluster-containing dehydrogenase component